MVLSDVRSLKDLKGKVVLLRVDYNVAVDTSGKIDTSKILASSQTINFLLSKGAKVVLISHFGSKVDADNANKSLKLILDEIRSSINLDFQFVENNIFDLNKEFFINSECNLFLLENIRFYKEEESCNAGFAKSLSSLGDLFVNEAFSASHRQHSSIILIPRFLPTYFGICFINEYEFLNKLVNSRKSLAIIGGNKISDKIRLIKSLLKRKFKVFLAGAIGATVKYFNRIRSNYDFETKKIVKYLSEHKNIILPPDFILNNGYNVSELSNIKDSDQIVDCGKNTISKIKILLKRIKFVIWNGPIGVYENSKFANGTTKLINLLSRYTKFGGKTVLGGGHTIAAVKSIGNCNNFTYVTHSGGAFLHFMSNKTLPGIDAVFDTEK